MLRAAAAEMGLRFRQSAPIADSLDPVLSLGGAKQEFALWLVEEGRNWKSVHAGVWQVEITDNPAGTHSTIHSDGDNG